MKVLLQRVSRAEVRVGGELLGRIGRGLLVLIGVEGDDGHHEVDYFADKTAELRIFADDDGLMNRSVREIEGEILVVSQFTLAGRTRRGRRPSFTDAASPAVAVPLYERFVEKLRATGLRVVTGSFGAMMEVELVNDGPVTLLLEPPRGGERP